MRTSGRRRVRHTQFSGGASLGGLVSLYLGLKHPEVFGGLIAASPSVWWDDRWILGYVDALDAPTSQKNWVDVGTAEPGETVRNARELSELLRSKGWTAERLIYVEEQGGQHSESSWARRVPGMLEFLFPVESE